MLETYSFPAFQTDWGNIQRDMLQIWVKVIFHLPWQLQADYCASFLPPKPGEVLLFLTLGGKAFGMSAEAKIIMSLLSV